MIINRARARGVVGNAPVAPSRTPVLPAQSARCVRSSAGSNDELQQHRRRLLLSLVPATASLWSWPGQALSFALDDLIPTQPQPVRFPRKPLDERFAVLLMRSCYEAVDSLDFIPMEDFQIKFWKLRQSEQEGYLMQYSPLQPRTGDLKDPLYFDFISFSQFATVSREMPAGRQVFQERCDEADADCPPGGKRTVRRDPALADNALLPERFYQLAGDNIYNGLLNGFRGEQFGAPPPCRPSSTLAELTDGIQKILAIMVARGYALKAEVLDVAPSAAASSSSSSSSTAASSGGSFRIRVQGPTNLWSLAALSFRRSLVLNVFDALAVDAYIRASGWMTSSRSIKFNDVVLEEQWTVSVYGGPAAVS